MIHSVDFIPQLPFEGYKWKWASLQCTESINDPIVLLGVLFRMRKLEILNLGYKYSSEEFNNEMKSLSQDISDSIGIDLAGRGGSRNLIRNSGQYWKALGLIPVNNRSGKITLTPFGRKVADREISQTEFASYAITHLELPNIAIQTQQEVDLWKKHGVRFKPLTLILKIMLALSETSGQGSLTVDELVKIVVPLSGLSAKIDDYTYYLRKYRDGEINISFWPNCAPEANDKRIAREFFLFLRNYGFLDVISDGNNRFEESFFINPIIISDVKALVDRAERINTSWSDDIIANQDITSEVERVRSRNRPNQANFRRQVLTACERCVVTNATMPEILEAAHIKPFKYNGEDTVANGFAMRTDIHILFDTGHLRISPEGELALSTKARFDYGMAIPPRIVIPSFINLDFVRWRWDNYNGY
ncbi:MAG: AlwI family type II restriction endonuclease [Muribaculaceae bacterium]|nr:AlwI family type II restriction endonuclease [Muribaculaceae bacterium]